MLAGYIYIVDESGVALVLIGHGSIDQGASCKSWTPGKSNILYIHKDKEAGDDPDIKGILKACCGV
ncbi:hypothetical protein RchiOBHm_Chr4g0422601 [Rosa chinensis]|uniref:Uncharacterized protein n=1 Tax=Rosa chinensis TaxID=74649 RepID=A0A2P6QYE0_ROSCH|nr:hypothetical protein RchiOBHm_Chr4g0422601 [Rosa chinensis]